MSGLYLERRDPERRMARFYALHLVPLLFGGWGVVREWGRIGHPGTVRTDRYGTEEEAGLFSSVILAGHRRAADRG